MLGGIQLFHTAVVAVVVIMAAAAVIMAAAAVAVIMLLQVQPMWYIHKAILLVMVR